MTVHQCPKCELRFAWQTELDDHCRTDHPAFTHTYPATAPPPVEAAAVEEAAEHEAYHPHLERPNPIGWLQPKRDH